MKKSLAILFVTVGLCSGLSAAADEGKSSEATEHGTSHSDHATAHADEAVGERIYARTCSVCHGERGNAASWAKNSLNPPPRDFTAAASKRLTRERMIGAVTHGVKDSAMMSFTTQFSSEEIAAVIDYVRATFMGLEAGHAGESSSVAAMPGEHDLGDGHDDGHAQEHGGDGHAGMHGGKADMTAAFPAYLVGYADVGKDIYKSNCIACHGAEGDGKGPRAYFLSRKPRDFTSDRARDELNRPHLFEAIAKGVRQTEMSAWSKVFSAQQIADVAEYVLTAFILPDPTAPLAAPASATNPASKKN